MPAPFITVTSARVKEGKLAAYMELNRRITEAVEAEEPRIIAFHVMINDDRDRFVGLQFHPDAESMEFHLETVRELISEAGDLLDIDEYKVLGASSEIVDGLMESMAESGIKVEHFPNHLGGFTRSSAAN